MGNNLPCGDSSPDKVLNDILESVQGDITTHVEKLAEEIPETYAKEHERIVEKMKAVSPRPYENLVYSDYPEKNQRDVNKLALEYTISTTAKTKITDGIYEAIVPKIDEKLADQNSLVQNLVKKGVKKAIEQTVDKTIDEIVKKIDLSRKPQQNGKRR